MNIINTGLFYFGTSGTAYHGKIKLSNTEFLKAIKHIMSNKKINRQYLGIGKYPYLSMELLKKDIASGIHSNGISRYSLGVSVTEYIVNLLQNNSRYHYKRQNYIIEVK